MKYVKVFALSFCFILLLLLALTVLGWGLFCFIEWKLYLSAPADVLELVRFYTGLSLVGAVIMTAGFAADEHVKG